MIRVGFRYIDAKSWQGGYNYLLNLCRGLLEFSDDCEPVVLVDKKEIPQDELRPFEEMVGEDFMDSPGFTRSKSGRSLPLTLLTGTDKTALRTFNHAHVDVVFEVGEFFGWRFGIPTIAWFPDFQHCRLPEMFPRKQRVRRELGFRAQCASRNNLMVSSNDAKRDCLEFYRVPSECVHVVPFAVPFEGLPSNEDRIATRMKHGISRPFVLTSNQFWRHKNHSIIADALQNLVERDKEVMVVATGGAAHPSNRLVHQELTARIERSELGEWYRLVGKVPFHDLVCLRADAVALLNPSLFEGWNTAVEEAKANGVTLILSDIPIHREQAPDGAIFFDPLDAGALAESLSLVFRSPPKRSGSATELKRQADLRREDFVSSFEEVVRGAFRKSGAD